MIDRLIDKLFNFEFREDPRRGILTGGWIILFAFLILLISHELLLYAVGVGLLGIAFVYAGYYYYKKQK